MPGIAGIISLRPADECQLLLQSMLASMQHESFYVSGTHFVPEMGVYDGWMAIEGSFAANQVFMNEQKDIAFLFSGECFADAGTRDELKLRGHDVGTKRSDWLVHSYEEEGDGFFERLNGLFSGLLIDKRKNQAFLFNDRYGIERIYYHEARDSVFFASEAKALLRVLPELRSFDDEGVAQFLAFGCNLDWRTLFKGVSVLPGASLWAFEHGNCRKTQYFTPAAWESQATLSVESFESEFQTTFKRVLPRYCESDSRIGISLTGGLDTRMIMACRPQNGHKPVCYTFAGAEGETEDAKIAAEVARACGLEHRLLRIGPSFFSDFGSLAERTVYLTDGCFGALGAHEVYLNRLLHANSPLRLTGVFGSEILRGVSTFKPARLPAELFQTAFHKTSALAALTKTWSELHPVTFAAFREIPWNIFGSLAACRSQVSFRTPFLDNEIVALAYRTPECLRHSPQTALRFLEQHNPTLAGIRTDRGYFGNGLALQRGIRRCLAEATFRLDYYYNEGLPQMLARFEPLMEITNHFIPLFGRHKYLHYRSWFRRELAGYLRETVEAQGVKGSLIFDPREARRMVDEHINGTRNRIFEIGAMLTVQAIERTLLRNRDHD